MNLLRRLGYGQVTLESAAREASIPERTVELLLREEGRSQFLKDRRGSDNPEGRARNRRTELNVQN